MYVLTDLNVADIFTKPLGLDKLRHFSDMVSVQYLNMPHLREREESAEQAESDERTKGSRLAKGRPAKCRGAKRQTS